MRTKRNSNKKNNKLFPIACVILCLLVILLIFLVKKDEIFTNLKETDFFGRVFGSTPEVIEKHEIKPSDEEIPLKNDIVVQVQETETVPIITKDDDAEIMGNEADVGEPVSSKNDAEVKEDKKSAVNKKEEKPVKQEKPKFTGTTKLELCFVMIDGDGSVVRKAVKRSVPKNDSPLTTAIDLLLKGPDLSNKAESECTSLIPEGSRLISARVSDGVAYLNFNDAFEFNPYGVEGSIHQLEQIVYTATAFSTVNSVQFLIEGEKREYLGSEGQWIGSPLSRVSF